MSGIFDRLQNELDIRQQEGGVSALDLADLPAPLRKLMRLMLREVEMEYESLYEAAKGMRKSDFTKKSDFDKALIALVESNWLIQRGQDKLKYYSVNLRRKAGSNLATGIWKALDKKIDNKEK